MKIPFFSDIWDERFLMHRLRSTSTGGVTAGIVAALLFAWHYYVDHLFSWDLLAVALTMIVVKWSLLLWYRFTD